MQNLGDQNVDAIRGVDNTMDRMQKARQMQLERRLMTERGMPAQMLAQLGRPDQTMNFGSSNNKFKTAFGSDGS